MGQPSSAGPTGQPHPSVSPSRSFPTEPRSRRCRSTIRFSCARSQSRVSRRPSIRATPSRFTPLFLARGALSCDLISPRHHHHSIPAPPPRLAPLEQSLLRRRGHSVLSHPSSGQIPQPLRLGARSLPGTSFLDLESCNARTPKLDLHHTTMDSGPCCPSALTTCSRSRTPR